MILKDLTVIEGIFADGLLNRQWKDQSGVTYDGNSNLSGQPHGKCKAKFKSGDRYDGDWHDGCKYGNGIYYPIHGPAYQGEWTGDKLVGYKILGDAAEN